MQVKRRDTAVVGGIAFAVFIVWTLVARFTAGSFDVRVIGQTNDGGTFCIVQVTNSTGKQYVYSAWTEYDTNGVWKQVSSHNQTGTVRPHASETFRLIRPEQAKCRVAILSGVVVESGAWDDYRDTAMALLGHPKRANRMYIDAP